MKLLRNICRILVGIVFIYSGFVKGVDPLGSDYKFTDYFNAFGMSWMGFSTLFFSFLLSMAEFLIGICLFLNIKLKTAVWGAILFMGFFTPLTLILAIKNPVTDCGCFGDALILTNWETFWKNIILLAMTLVIFYTRDKYKPIFNFLEQTVVLVGTVIFMFCIQWYSFRHLPIVDFRPYAIGKNISEGMAIPDGAPHDEYAITLKYKNKQTGEVKDFTEENVITASKAIAKYVYDNFGLDKTIIIGYDSRNMADVFSYKCAEIFADNGFEVLYSSGIIPTPVLAYNAKHLNACALMFTASHNPPEYLGIKFIPDYAGPATSDITDEIMYNLGSSIKEHLKKGEIKKYNFKPDYFAHLNKLID